MASERLIEAARAPHIKKLKAALRKSGLSGSQQRHLLARNRSIDQMISDARFFERKFNPQRNQDIRDKIIGERFSSPLFSPAREAVVADIARQEAGERRSRGFTGALRGGRAFLARTREEDANDKPFLGA